MRALGDTLGLLFQIDFEQPDDMSPLVGQQFEMTYYPQQETEIDKTDVDPNGFTVAAGEFYVSVKAIGNTLLPGVSKIVEQQNGEQKETGLVPRVGDKVTLVNM